MTRLTTYVADLKAALEDRLVPVEGGPLGGQLMMSAGVMQEAIAAVAVPPVDEHVAELATPATVYVDLRCHICGESTRSTINIESKTLVDDKRRTIAPKIDADTVSHMCGQMPLPVGYEEPGQEAFDWTIPVEDIGTGIPAVVDMLARVGVVVAEDDVAGWTEQERESAMRWAVAVHVARQSDEAIPDAPEAMARDGHPAIVVGDALGEAEPDPAEADDTEAAPTDVCPFPGCTRAPDHRGGHKDAKGKTIRVDSRPPDVGPEDAGDLLPE